MANIDECFEKLKAAGIEVEKMIAEGVDVAMMYAKDDYPRLGCRAAIDYTNSGYMLTIFDPTGRPIETYLHADTPRGVARMLEEWLVGYAPRNRDRLDYSPEKS